MPDSQKLRRGLWEGFVIVSSILLAFGIEAWWDDRQEREASGQFIEYLQEELLANRALIEQTVSVHSGQLEAFEFFFADSTGTFEALQEDSAQVLARTIGRVRTISLSENVIRSSDASSVRDRHAQRRMGAWMGSADDVQEDLPGMVQLANSMSRHIIDLSPEIYRFGTMNGSGRAALRALRRDPAIIREGLVLRNGTGINRRKLNELLAETDSLLAVIRE